MEEYLKDLEKNKEYARNKYLDMSDTDLSKTLIGVVPIYLAFVMNTPISPVLVNLILRNVTIICALLSIIFAILQLFNSKILYKRTYNEQAESINIAKNWSENKSERVPLIWERYLGNNLDVRKIWELGNKSEALLYASLINILVSMIAAFMAQVI